MTGTADARRAVTLLWARVPDVDCKGLCAGACGAVLYSRAEGELATEAHGLVPVATADGTCSALADGRCSIYDRRPMICRLYGAAADLRCGHGCRPRGGPLPAATARRLLDLAERHGGGIDPRALASSAAYLERLVEEDKAAMAAR